MSPARTPTVAGRPQAPGRPPTPTRPRVAGERRRPAPEPVPPRRVTTSQAATGPRSRRLPRLRLPRRPALLLLLALTVVALLAASLVTVEARQAQALADARTAAVERARVAAEVVLSYDHETLDEDFAAALALTTGTFRDEYARTSEGAVRPVATETRAVVEAEVVSAGVVTAAPDEVVVLLFVNQTTTSTRLDAPQTDQNRVRMTMTRSGDAWLVSAVDAL